MKRKEFFKYSSLAVGAAAVNPLGISVQNNREINNLRPSKKVETKSQLAITMWDFSWLERRWPGAGFEDWDEALDGLLVRGYNAVRIDAYPHLVAENSEKEWELLPEWSVQDWGAPARCRVQVQPHLNSFIRKCKDRGIKVGLSTWFREDIDNIRLKLKKPEDHIAIWKKTLIAIKAEGLLDTILYVDCNNEFPSWSKFLPDNFKRNSLQGVEWMQKVENSLRDEYPDIPFTFSFASGYENWKSENVSMHDFLELHLWMTNYSEFYKEINYNYERFDIKAYDRVQLNAERLYRSKPQYWQSKLREGIQLLVNWSKTSGKPLVTTECWGIVDYKDFPMLNWDWVKELCAIGTTEAAKTGQWLAIATSNFCGPQFKGMWRDIDWHQRLTQIIKTTAIGEGLTHTKLYNRL